MDLITALSIAGKLCKRFPENYRYVRLSPYRVSVTNGVVLCALIVDDDLPECVVPARIFAGVSSVSDLCVHDGVLSFDSGPVHRSVVCEDDKQTLFAPMPADWDTVGVLDKEDILRGITPVTDRIAADAALFAVGGWARRGAFYLACPSVACRIPNVNGDFELPAHMVDWWRRMPTLACTVAYSGEYLGLDSGDWSIVGPRLENGILPKDQVEALFDSSGHVRVLLSERDVAAIRGVLGYSPSIEWSLSGTTLRISAQDSAQVFADIPDVEVLEHGMGSVRQTASPAVVRMLSGHVSELLLSERIGRMNAESWELIFPME